MPKWLAAAVEKPEPGGLSSTGSTNAPSLQWRVHAGPGLDRKSGQARARLSLRAHVSGSCSLLQNVTATCPMWATLRRLSGWSSTPDCITGATEPKGRLHGGPGVEAMPLALSKNAKQQEHVPLQLMQTFLTSLETSKTHFLPLSCCDVMWLRNA